MPRVRRAGAARPALRRDRAGRVRGAVACARCSAPASSPFAARAGAGAGERGRAADRGLLRGHGRLPPARRWCGPGPGAAGRGCATSGRMPSTTSPRASAPGWRCPRRCPSSAPAGRRSCASRSGRSPTTTGSPGASTTRLDRLKERLSDPVGDRLVESLRIAREVGGTDLGHLLRTLSGFLREDARTRAELETRQSWTVNAARLAVAAPWAVLAMLSTNPESVAAYSQRDRRRACWSSGVPSPRSPTGRWCASAGSPRTSGCCDERARAQRRRPRLRARARPGPGLAGPAPAPAAGPGRAGAALPARHPRALAAARRRPPAGRCLRRSWRGRSSATSAAVVERVMGGADSVRRRQLRAGLAADVDRFRAEQVLWGALGAVVGGGVGVLALRAAGCRGRHRRDAHRDRVWAWG